MKKTVVFDFDGVINSYKHGWEGVATINDPPTPGIKDEIKNIRKKYRVVVMSTRANSSAGKAAIQKYLDKYDITVDAIVDHKIAAHAYIDDRAIPFNGKAKGLLNEIELFTPWHDDVKIKVNKSIKK